MTQFDCQESDMLTNLEWLWKDSEVQSLRLKETTVLQMQPCESWAERVYTQLWKWMKSLRVGVDQIL